MFGVLQESEPFRTRMRPMLEVQFEGNFSDLYYARRRTEWNKKGPCNRKMFTTTGFFTDNLGNLNIFLSEK